MAVTEFWPARETKISLETRPKSRFRPRWPSAPQAQTVEGVRRISIAQKTFFWLILQTLIVVLAFALLVNWAFDKGITEYMSQFDDSRAADMADVLGGEYAKSGGWGRLQQSPELWANMAMRATGHRVSEAPEDSDRLQALFSAFHEGEFPTALPAPLPLRFVLMDPSGAILIGNPRAHAEFRKVPISVHGRVVGYVAFSESPISTYDLRFQQRFLAALLVIIVGSFLLALVPAILIARFVTQPVKAIGQAARRLAQGETDIQLPVKSGDELGDLCRDFNGLSAALAKHENLQRLWLAELSHELRTPVAILVAEIEAMLDDIRPMDRQGMVSLHDESRRLSRLIGDLHQLCLADFGAVDYAREPVNLTELVRQCVDGMRARFAARRLEISLSVPKSRCLIEGDADKLRQVFLNLLENSLRYTDEGGTIVVKLVKTGRKISVEIEDSLPSVPAREIDHLFERLYRGESSRNRRSGGSGLGLAIVKSIVEGHQGAIAAKPSALGGLRFELSFEGRVR